MSTPLLVEGDYSYFSETKYGANYAMVGDAAQFIDPIFSSGVYLAMRSAQLVSNAVHQRFEAGAEAGQAELKLAYDKIAGAYRLILKLITFFYDAGAINFAQMESAVEAIHQEHEHAMAVGHYLLAGDFFERYEHYGSVIDALRKPHLYEYYKEDVLGRVQLQATSCDADPAVVFHRLQVQHATSAMNAD
jgi:flavin-dependent dehydrogenase